MKKFIPLAVFVILAGIGAGCKTQDSPSAPMGKTEPAPGPLASRVAPVAPVPPVDIKPPPEMMEPPVKIMMSDNAGVTADMNRDCRGEFKIVNNGPSQITRPGVKKPRYEIGIFDAKGTLLFKNYGAWSGASSTNGIPMNWDTKSNHIGEKSGPPFKFTQPGQYQLRVDVYADDGNTLMSSVTNTFMVHP